MTDTIQRFSFVDHDLRGAIVYLEQSFATIILQHHYPKPIADLLGQTLLATVLMTSSIKFRGQITTQFYGDGPLQLMVAKCDHDNNIRALAQWDHDVVANEVIDSVGNGSLVVTIEQFDQVKPYQSIVPLENRTVANALEHYFKLSEQLATRFWLAVDGDRAVGLMLQAMPGHSPESFAELISGMSIQPDRLLKEDAQTLLKNQFQEDIRLYETKPIQFNCTCSIEKMEDALKVLGEGEARDILVTNKEIAVTCEYCNHEYSFDKIDVDRIFTP